MIGSETMVDTMTIYHTFNNYSEYQETIDIIKDHINNFNSNASLHRKKNTNIKITYAFAAYGIEEMYFTQNISYIIYMKVRPKLMIEQGNYDDVLRAYDLPKLYDKFDSLMRDIGLHSIANIKKWHVKRIDYAIDIAVDQELIPRYIDLFNKGNIPEAMVNDPVSLMYQKTDNNLYLSSKSVRVNFYDRYTTALEKKMMKSDKYFNIQNRCGVLRFEVQLRDIDTVKLKKAKKIRANTVDDFMRIDMCKEYILRYYTMIIGCGDYYGYYEALRKCRSNIQKNMIRLINEEGCVYKAKRRYILSSSDGRKSCKQFSEIINKLERIGINPVTLESGTLKNLYEKILYAIEGSNKFQIRRRAIQHEK